MGVKILIAVIGLAAYVSALTFDRRASLYHKAEQIAAQQQLSPESLVKLLSFMVDDEEIMQSLSQGKEITSEQQQRITDFMIDDDDISNEIFQNFVDQTGFGWANDLSPQAKKNVLKTAMKYPEPTPEDEKKIIDDLQQNQQFKKAFQANFNNDSTQSGQTASADLVATAPSKPVGSQQSGSEEEQESEQEDEQQQEQQDEQDEEDEEDEEDEDEQDEEEDDEEEEEEPAKKSVEINKPV